MWLTIKSIFSIQQLYKTYTFIKVQFKFSYGVQILKFKRNYSAQPALKKQSSGNLSLNNKVTFKQ